MRRSNLLAIGGLLTCTAPRPSGRQCGAHLPWRTVPGSVGLPPRNDKLDKNKNPFIHIRDEGLLRGTTRITFSNWNVPTFQPANVTLVAITGFSVTSYSQLCCVHWWSPSLEVTGEFGLVVFPFHTGEGLTPRSPFSLTGW